jgi:hypothetical protein
MCSKAPSLHGRYPASPLLRASPPPSRLPPTSRLTPVIRLDLLRRFLDGTRRVSPVARHVLITVPSLPPRRSKPPRQPVCASSCCLHPWKEGSASEAILFGATCGFTSVTARRLAHHPKDGFVGWLHRLRFLHLCNPSYGALTSTPVGLSPTEHASLRWTHFPTGIPTRARSGRILQS